MAYSLLQHGWTAPGGTFAETRRNPAEEDPASTARGIVFGSLVSLLFWSGLGLLLRAAL